MLTFPTPAFFLFIIISIQKMIKIMTCSNVSVKIMLWDTSGREERRAPRRAPSNSHFRGVHGFLLCYDITQRESFANVVKYQKFIDEQVVVNSAVLHLCKIFKFFGSVATLDAMDHEYTEIVLESVDSLYLG